MVRLPTPGADDDVWGDILNEFLEVSLDNTNLDEDQRGKLKPTAVAATGAYMKSEDSAADVAYDDTVLSAYSVTGDDVQEVVDNFGTAMAGAITDLSTNVVRLTGAQTIAGNKIFTNNAEFRVADDAQGKVWINGFSGGWIRLFNNATDTQPGTTLHSANGLRFGPGGSSAADTIITRASANVLNFNSARLTSLTDPTNAQDAATKNYVDTASSSKANDADVVKLTGNQTVAGEKTFTDTVAYDGGAEGAVIATSGGGGQVLIFGDASDNSPNLALASQGGNGGIGFGGGGNGIDNGIARAGANNLTINVGLGDTRLSGVADPTDPQDAATKKYVDDNSTGQVADAGLLSARPSAASLPNGFIYFAVDDDGGTASIVIDGVWVKQSLSAAATSFAPYGEIDDDNVQGALENLDKRLSPEGLLDRLSTTAQFVERFDHTMGFPTPISYANATPVGKFIAQLVNTGATNAAITKALAGISLSTTSYHADQVGTYGLSTLLHAHSGLTNTAQSWEWSILAPNGGPANGWTAKFQITSLAGGIIGFQIGSDPVAANQAYAHAFAPSYTSSDTTFATGTTTRLRLSHTGGNIWRWYVNGSLLVEQAVSGFNPSAGLMNVGIGKNASSGGSTERTLIINQIIGVLEA